MILSMHHDQIDGHLSFPFIKADQPCLNTVSLTRGFLTIGAVFLIGVELGKINGSRGLFPGLLAVICFIAVTPTTIEMTVNGRMMVVKDG